MAVMTVMKGLRLSGALDDQERRLLEAAIGESERMKNLIRNLQDFYRPYSSNKSPVNLHATIDSLLLLYKSDFYRRKIKIDLHYTKELPHVLAIPDQIKQVFINLLNNAAEACPDKGGTIAISTWREKDMAAVAIKDTGTGIQPDDMEHIFRPFFSTKAEVKGTGLGLSVSYGIVKNHHGEIRVESQPGAGATFTVLLPVNAANPASSE
jgi:signal transduction histidine kinase